MKAELRMKFLLIFEKIHYIYFTIRIRGVQFRLLDNYMEQRRAGKDPVFRREMMPEDEADIECWD